MARSWTLQQIRNRALRAGDMVNSTFVDASLGGEVDDWINAHLCEVWDLLIQASPADYYVNTTDITTVAFTTDYALPSDFRALVAVYGVESAGNAQLRPIRPVNEFDRAYYQAPQGAYTVRLKYIPVPPILGTIAGNADTFDGIAGWEELIVSLVAKEMKDKEESDSSVLAAKIAEMKARIRSVSPRDRGAPRYITDTEASDIWLYPNTVHIRAYQLAAGNITLLEPTIPFP